MTRRIDHLVVAVRDLDKAAAFYQRLGFQVGARNYHPWGTENRLVQFKTAFIELVTVGADVTAIVPHTDRSFSFGAFLHNYLKSREGLAMLVLNSEDARADAAHFMKRKISTFEPFFFERKGHKPDGSEVTVSFTVANVQVPDLSLAGFFVCQHHFPENFWNAAFQVHANKAEDVVVVALSAPEPEREADFLTAFTGVFPTSLSEHNLTFTLAGSHLHVMKPDNVMELYGSSESEVDQLSFTSFTVGIADLQNQALLLDAAQIPYHCIGSRLVVPGSAAFGVTIAFETM